MMGGKYSSPSVLSSERVPLLDSKHEENNDFATLHNNPETHRQSLLTRLRLIIMLTLAFSFLIISAQALSKRPSKHDSLCLTPECVLASAEILSSRSPDYANIEPCDDFRSYMCDGWDQTHDLRSDQSEAGSFSVLAERGETLLRHILEAPYPENMTSGQDSSVEKENFEKLQDAYDSCMNETVIHSKGAAPLLALMKQVREMSGADQPLSHVLSFMMEIGIEPLVTLGIDVRLIHFVQTGNN